jgi:hypothetical protein
LGASRQAARAAEEAAMISTNSTLENIRELFMRCLPSGLLVS